jgi:hypothetical protein
MPAEEPPPPPNEIPAPTAPLVRPRLAYLANGSTWNLSTEDFWVWLGDTPKALLLRCPAQHIATDAKFFYYRDLRTELEWAFVRAPEHDFLIGRPVWSRRDQGQWQVRTTEATLATPG